MSDLDLSGVPAHYFTLWCNNTSIDLDADIFAQFSTKAHSLLTEGRRFAIIHTAVHPDAFSVFISAIQGRRFDITPSIAFELLSLAQDWEVTSLEEITNTFIDTNRLQPPDHSATLNDILQKLESTPDRPTILAAANLSQEAFQDPFMLDLPPEVIFEIVIAARANGNFDDSLFANYVIKRFGSDPQSAVPLVLLHDFDSLTSDQRSLLFKCREMYEQNVGFFVAESLSAARNQAARELDQAEAEFRANLRGMRRDLQTKEIGEVSEIRANHSKRILELRSELDKQQKQIEALKTEGEKVNQAISTASERNEEEFAELRMKLERLASFTNQQSAQAAGQTSKVEAEIGDQMERLRREINEKVNALAGEDAALCETAESDLKRTIDGQGGRLKELRGKNDRLAKELTALSEQFGNLKSVLAAKIVKDRLKNDRFLRQTDRRFEVFSKQTGLWELTPESVRESENFIMEIEDKVDGLCPIRGT
jgi:archaellum component FlaC